MSDCCCLEIQVVDITTGETSIYALLTDGTIYEGRCVYSFTNDTGTYYWWWDAPNGLWQLSDSIGGGTTIATWKEDVDCPATEGSPEGVGMYGVLFSSVITRDCVDPCDCILIGIIPEEDPENVFSENLEPTGTYNNRPYWTWIYNGITYVLYYDGTQWIIASGSIGGSQVASLESTDPCPDKEGWLSKQWNIFIELGECICDPLQERVFAEFESIKLPTIFEEENRGFFKCCEPQMVLASTTSTDTWKNDITSAWIKLSDPSDSATILLTKDGASTSYPVNIIDFPNEPNAIYRTIYWRDVLALEGEGCYKIEISYSIGGMTGNFTWGVYKLQSYSIDKALKTARIRVLLNLKQEIEGINFTDANVEDTCRFYGFIGNRQPNMEIDNLVYQSRIVRSVVRENLNTYEINTDPYSDEMISRLTDLYLLSENEMFISDYNAFNHTYKLQDTPVIVQESPEIDYIDQYQRKAKLSCIVGDKTKNARTFY